MTFITEDANFCYKVMLCDLKNAGTTYQRLMDRVFKQQIDRNVEVYVDADTHTHTHSHTPTHRDAHNHTHAHKQRHTHTHTYTHIPTHTTYLHK